jgi:aquaporin Z
MIVDIIFLPVSFIYIILHSKWIIIIYKYEQKTTYKSNHYQKIYVPLDFRQNTHIEKAFIIYFSCMKKYIAELLGVLFFVLIIGLSWDPLAIGVGLAILVYATGPISWGHLNPAVTLSLLIWKKIRVSEAVNYRVAQLIWGILWAVLYRVLKWNTIIIMPLDWISIWRAWLWEFIFTFLLAMVVYLTAVYKKADGNQYRGAAIWLTVFVAAVSVGRMTGGAFNPAVATWSILIDRLHGGDSGMYLWMYIISTLLGWFAAGHLCKVFKNDHITQQ